MKKLLAFLLSILLPVPFLVHADSVPEIISVSVCAGVVSFSTDTDITAYCFHSVPSKPSLSSHDWMSASGRNISVFKKDASFYLFVRSGDSVSSPVTVNVTSPFSYAVDAEGLSYLKEPASSVMDIDEVNSILFNRIADAGIYTREGVLTAALTLLTEFGSRGLTVPYQGSGSYQQQDDWGVNPEWGSKLKHPTSDANGTYKYCGMQCVASIVWAYKQAGLNLSNEGTGYRLGNIGARNKTGDNKIDYRDARGGDIVANDAHYLMIVDRLDTNGDGEDDAYLTYEMQAPDLVLLVHSFRSVRYLDFYNMDAVFENESRVLSRQRFFGDTVFIPESYFPEALQNAISSAAERRAWGTLVSALGF